MRTDYDLIVVGGGHNALVSAAYVAQAGYRVAVFERCDLIGGAVSTTAFVPGYQFDLGGSAHILIRLTPIVEELGLERFGLEYIEVDPLFFSPGLEADGLFIYRDLDATAAHLDALFPGEGEAYRAFVNEWRPFARTVCDSFLERPDPFDIGKTWVGGDAGQIQWQQALSTIIRPYGDVVDAYFKEERLKTMLTWMAAQSGPPPTEALTAPFLLWHPLYHEGGIARPRGGSGMLTQALQRHIEAHGGAVFLSAPVDEICVESGRAVGVRVGKEVYTARRVLAGTHVTESLGRLLPEAYRPPELAQMRIGNGFGAILRLALTEPIRYACCPTDEARVPLQLICRDRQQIRDAYGDFLRGLPSEDPPLVAMSFSAVDDTLAPPGGEVLWLWAQYYPYALRDFRSWDDHAEEAAENILDRFEAYAPGTKAKVVGRLFQHPVWLERSLGLPRGNVMHLEMTLDQMFFFRPAAKLSGYRTHVDGLYITGASTHPGGGIMGASGRYASRLILWDIS